MGFTRFRVGNHRTGQNNSTKWLFWGVISFIITILLCEIISYNNVSYISCFENINISKRGGKIFCTISTDATSDNIELYNVADWIDYEKNGKDYIFNIKPNYGDKRSILIKLYAFSTVFGIKINHKEREIELSQESGLATYLKVNKEIINIGKERTDNPKQFYVMTDGMNIEMSEEGDFDFDFVIEDDIEESDTVAVLSYTNIISKKSDLGDYFQYQIKVSVDTNYGDRKESILKIKSGSKERDVKIIQESGLEHEINVYPSY